MNIIFSAGGKSIMGSIHHAAAIKKTISNIHIATTYVQHVLLKHT